MHSGTRWLRALSVSTLVLALAAGCAKTRTVTVNPVETDEVLVNPGIGFTTFYSFNGDPINAHYPECSIAYFRWYWDVLEPEEGKVNFALIDSVLALCHAHGQRLAFRVMCQNGHEMADKSVTVKYEVPLWYVHSGAKGWLYPDKQHWQPDYDDPLFLEKHGNLIRALAARYDGHPDLDHVDIGSVGRWGEWHTEGLPFPMPTLENHEKVIDLYVDNFKQTPLVMNLEESPATAYAISRGTGWRADCLGDMSVGEFYDENGNGENHQLNRYPRIIGKFVPPEVWKTAPVVFETCWNMGHWFEQGWDVDSILNQALVWHISVLNNKSFDVPEAIRPNVDKFLKRMGYRFVLASLSYPERVFAGDSLNVEMNWLNRGVAPCYGRYELALALRHPQTGETAVCPTGQSVRGWLPGETRVTAAIQAPPQLTAGSYDLLVGLVDPADGSPKVKLALQGRQEDGWYKVGALTIR